MPKLSAGILVYRMKKKMIEVFLCHPGGPFYKNKDNGVWTIPKGEFDETEEAFIAAKREFEEETGQKINGDFIAMKPIRYKDGRKIVYAWAVEGDVDTANIKSNTFLLEWPPKSGKHIETPEVDKGEWFTIEEAKQKILPSLSQLIEDLVENIAG
ncbi:MAG TPA: NUDIX domain-containing protein [Chitinophagaceae bacterium]|jgi:predicted NUDIX family NTP pyrophosphohydrolase|nr:NUDIX domain-containing protein [Chitinophagaceae bacterium]